MSWCCMSSHGKTERRPLGTIAVKRVCGQRHVCKTNLGCDVGVARSGTSFELEIRCGFLLAARTFSRCRKARLS